MSMIRSLLALAISSALLTACSPAEQAAPAPAATPKPQAAAVQPAPAEQAEPDEAEDVTTVDSGVKYEAIAEAFLTASTPDDNIDSPASWQAEDGKTWLIGSAKGTHKLVIYDGDSGATLQTFGKKGSELGEFKRPNGVFVIDDLAWVVERDNQRVQVLRLPALQPIGSFGQAELQKPYGLWLRRSQTGFEVLVSDAFMSEANEDLPPANELLAQRYKRYAVRIDGEQLNAELLGHVGATDAAGAIRIPESLWGDEQNQRLLLAEEDQTDGTRIKVYNMDFNYAGQDIGKDLFRAQAEGIALWQCADGSGYWLTTDQYKDRSVFHVFDRQSLAHLGAFAGNTVSNTDGVWLQQAATQTFPNGVFYAVHDDQGVGAFDWRHIAQTLKLRESCQ
ncbi:phytase [Pseudomarimonas arenosa]|uniref:Phytase n=1 Tax=Pseudomarimonas arenosa TaxID=2774145 RepID=A0AAW3ZFQ9_9GAMM|nr:phytase [Pseudomarimonas arenosa]MBD8524988.1 phytase [Pseudomarimonas arenosa]